MCHPSHGSRSGRKKKFKSWKIVSKQEKNSVGPISQNTGFALADNHWFQRRWSKKLTVSTITASTGAQCSDLELEATTKAKLKGQKTQTELSTRFLSKNVLTMHKCH